MTDRTSIDRRSFCRAVLGGSVLSTLLDPAAARSAARMARRPQEALDTPGTLPQELAAARRAGLATRPSDLQVPVPPDEQNAAVLYQRLGKLRDKVMGDAFEPEAVRLAGEFELSPAEVRTVRAALERHPDITGLVHRAADCERFVVQRDWSRTQDDLVHYSSISPLRFAARWLLLEAALLWAAGKVDQAVSTAALCFHLARQAASDPLVISYVVAEAIDEMGSRGLASLVHASGGDPDVCCAVAEAVARGRQPHSFVYALRGETLFFLAAAQAVRKKGPSDFARLVREAGEVWDSPGRWARPNHWERFVDLNVAYGLWCARHLAGSEALPYPEGKALRQRLMDDVEHRVAAREPRALVTASGGPGVMWHAGTMELRARAKALCLQAGTAVLLHHSSHGDWPAQLGAAVAAVPPDPFDDKPLRYRREDAGFVVYSVGESLAFEGGKPGERAAAREPLFRWPSPRTR